jgi:hypothetical protein
MNTRRAFFALVGLLLSVAALALTPGCTKWDDWLPGSPFTPAQPEAEGTLTGAMNAERIAESTTGCTPGGTVFWGQVTNTGDMDVTEVSIAIDVFNAAGVSLGTFGGTVFNGEVETDVTDPDHPIVIAGTSLVVDQSGTFTVCTPVPYGTAAHTEYQTRFIVVEEVP